MGRAGILGRTYEAPSPEKSWGDTEPTGAARLPPGGKSRSPCSSLSQRPFWNLLRLLTLSTHLSALSRMMQLSVNASGGKRMAIPLPPSHPPDTPSPTGASKPAPPGTAALTLTKDQRIGTEGLTSREH